MIGKNWEWDQKNWNMKDELCCVKKKPISQKKKRQDSEKWVREDIISLLSISSVIGPLEVKRRR